MPPVNRSSTMPEQRLRTPLHSSAHSRAPVRLRKRSLLPIAIAMPHRTVILSAKFQAFPLRN